MSSNGEKIASGEAFPGIDLGEDFFGGLFSKTFEAGYGAIFASALESTEGTDGKLVVESFDFFWPEPLEFKEFEELLYAWHFIENLAFYRYRCCHFASKIREPHFGQVISKRV